MLYFYLFREHRARLKILKVVLSKTSYQYHKHNKSTNLPVKPIFQILWNTLLILLIFYLFFSLECDWILNILNSIKIPYNPTKGFRIWILTIGILTSIGICTIRVSITIRRSTTSTTTYNWKQKYFEGGLACKFNFFVLPIIVVWFGECKSIQFIHVFSFYLLKFCYFIRSLLLMTPVMRLAKENNVVLFSCYFMIYIIFYILFLFKL